MRYGGVYSISSVCFCLYSLFHLHFLTAMKLYKCFFFFPVLLSHICLCLSISSPSYHLVKLSPHHLDPRGGWFFSLLTASCRPQSGSLFNQRPLLSIPFPLLCCPPIKPVLSGWMCRVRWLAWGWNKKDSIVN